MSHASKDLLLREAQALCGEVQASFALAEPRESWVVDGRAGVGCWPACGRRAGQFVYVALVTVHCRR